MEDCKNRKQKSNYLRKCKRYNMKQLYFGTLALALCCYHGDKIRNSCKAVP